ncbi:MAG: Smr/MutS family endonuclease [Gammaproteobacteria bacterium]|nr:Smr/MutS family endonuclease [Gammaproteobacteria bacterium]
MADSDEQKNKHNDYDLFRQAMSDVTPIQQNKVSFKKKPGPIKKRPAEKRQSITDTLSDDFIPECNEYLEFMRPGIQKTMLKQLRNGKLPIEDHLDLHGYTRDMARKTLLEFIHHSQHQGYRVVCLVHGKGYNSDDGRPVLKAMVNKWLQNIDQVLAFTSAQPGDGGTGAVYVLIKRAVNEA